MGYIKGAIYKVCTEMFDNSLERLEHLPDAQSTSFTMKRHVNAEHSPLWAWTAHWTDPEILWTPLQNATVWHTPKILANTISATTNT